MKWSTIYTNLPVDVIVRLPHLRTGESQGQETFLAPSADKKTRNYDIEFSKHHPSLSTLRPNGLSRSKMKWSDIHINFPVDVIVRLPHLRNGNRQGQEIFLASSAYKKSRHYDIEWSKRHPSLSTIRPKRLSRSQMKWWALYTNLPDDVIVRLPHPRIEKNQRQITFLAPSAEKQTRKYDIECSNHHPSLRNLTPKGLSRSKMKSWAIYKNLPVDVIIRLPHPQSGDSQGQETFLARPADKQTCHCDIECSDHHPSLSNPIPNGLSLSKMKWWAIYKNLPVDVIIRLHYPRSGDSQKQETLLARSAEKPTRNYDIECSNQYPSLSTPSTKGLSRSKMKWWAIQINLPVDVIIRLPHPPKGNRQGQETFLASTPDKQTRHYDIECSKHHPSLSTLRPNGLSPSKMKWWALYTNLPVDVIVRLPHPRIGNSQGHETFLAHSAYKKTHKYDIECSNHHPSLSTLIPKG